MSGRPVAVLVDEPNRLVVVNGVAISFEVLGALTQTTPPGQWIRFERKADEVVIYSKQEPVERLGLSL